MAGINKTFGIHVKCRYFWLLINKFGIYRQFFHKSQNTKFPINPSSRGHVDTYRQMHPTLTDAFLDYLKARAIVIFPFPFDPVTSTAPESGNRFQWLCRSVVARLLELRVRFSPAKWIFVYCECCVVQVKVYCECCVVQVKVFAKGRSLVQGSPTDFVRVPLSVIRCCGNHLHLQRLGRRRHVKKLKKCHWRLHHSKAPPAVSKSQTHCTRKL